ncbi:MAG: acyl-CoA thioesterase domain-containing protein [Actinomycetota bacterium]
MDTDELIDLLTVEPAGPDRFIGHSPADRDRQVYGGQFLAQALLAAAATVDADRPPHSLHAYFLRTGAAHTPIEYRVERIRDGRTASHRAVIATQDGREVFRQLVSFQIERPGLTYPPPRPGPAGDPADMMSYRQWVADLSDSDAHPWFAENLPIDLRLDDPPPTEPRAPMDAALRVWMRVSDPGGTIDTIDDAMGAAMLAWLSDKTISDVVLYPHGRSWTDAGSDILSLDHAMWFHEPVRLDQWLLLTHEPVATRRGRGLARGDFLTSGGQLVASVAQEAYIVLPDGDQGRSG